MVQGRLRVDRQRERSLALAVGWGPWAPDPGKDLAEDSAPAVAPVPAQVVGAAELALLLLQLT